MSKKKDKQEVVNEEVLNVTEPEITINGGEVNKPDEENIIPDIVNVEAGAPEINSEEKTEDVEPTTEGETEPEEKTEDEEKSEEEVVEEMVTLITNKNFTDKYDSSIKYKKGKEYEFTAKRAKELLSDERDLVSKVK